MTNPAHEIGISRGELRSLTVVTWLCAAIGGFASGYGADILLNAPAPISGGISFATMAFVFYPLARIWYRVWGNPLSASKYAAVWLGTIVAVTTLWGIIDTAGGK